MKIKNIFKSKFKIATITIIIGMVILGLTTPIFTHANFWTFLGLDKIATGFVIAIGSAIAWFMNWLVTAAASFFEGMLGVGFKNTLSTIKVGWTVCRDFANMLFILFMVIIAFATILRVQNYGIKKLLPKVIGVALLINFSMVFCSIFIDFSNIIADFFIKDIKGQITGSNGENGALTATFADAFNLSGVYITYTNCSDFTKDMKAQYCDPMPNVEDKEKCYATQDSYVPKCEKLLSQSGAIHDASIDATGPGFLNVFLGYTVGSIILLIAAFALFAGGIMLLFRIIAIWFLVTLSPLAFMCYILPSLQSNWQKWWKTFLNWCIFAPAYSFFIWMAIKIATSSAIKNIQGEAMMSTLPPNFGSMNNKFITSPGDQLIGYFIIIGFLIGGLIVAKQLGIYGADAVMNIATNARKGATNAIKNKGKKVLGETRDMYRGAARQLAGKGLQAIGLRTTGARMEARGKLDWRKPLNSKNVKQLEAEAALMNDGQRAAFLKSKFISSAKKVAVAKIVASKDKDKMDTKTARSTHNILKAYSYQKEADNLKDARPDIISSKNLDDRKANIKAEIEKMKKEGKMNLISLAATKDEQTREIIETILGGTTKYLEWISQKEKQIIDDRALEDILKRKMDEMAKPTTKEPDKKETKTP